MAETDMKPLSELDIYNNLLDSNSLLPMTVNLSNSNITRKVYFNSLKTQIAGYDIIGTLTAGNTSITLSSAPTATYSATATYKVGDRIRYTGSDDVVRNYICVAPVSGSNRTWNTDAHCFVEYDLLDSNSTVIVFTKVGNGPYVVAGNVIANVENNAITLTFSEQLTDILVKVRVI